MAIRESLTPKPCNKDHSLGKIIDTKIHYLGPNIIRHMAHGKHQFDNFIGA